MDVIVHLGTALLCLAHQCFPVLIGTDTPTGEFTLTQRIVSDKMYGNSILQFKETEDEVYAIHRIWNGLPQERRNERIKSKNFNDRVITKGCINVDDTLYTLLLTNYQGSRLVITK